MESAQLHRHLAEMATLPFPPKSNCSKASWVSNAWFKTLLPKKPALAKWVNSFFMGRYPCYMLKTIAIWSKCQYWQIGQMGID